MSHYTAIVLITSVSLIGFIIGINGNRFIDTKQKHWFQVLFFALIVANISEWLAASLDGNVALINLRIASKFLELSITPTIVLIVMIAVGNKKLLKTMFCIATANIILQIISLFTGVVFSIDSTSTYHRNSLYMLYIAFFIAASIILIINVADYAKKYQMMNRSLLTTIFVMEALSIAEQFAFPYLRLDWVMATFTVILFYLYIDQLQQQVDSLTNLLNRRIYDVHIQKLADNVVVVVFDVDRFKAINDTYGHSVGDECLKQIAIEMRRVFDRKGYCYRVGGDEFCILSKQDESQVKKLLEQLSEQVAASRFGDNLPLPRLSYGFVTVGNGKSYKEAVREADQMMYQNKKKHREEEANQ